MNFFLKFEFFCENHPPTRHINYKRRGFTPCNKSIMANMLFSTNLERFLRRIKSRLRVKSEIYRALIVPHWSKMAIFKPP